jgi:hypothetical protein
MSPWSWCCMCGPQVSWGCCGGQTPTILMNMGSLVAWLAHVTKQRGSSHCHSHGNTGLLLLWLWLCQLRIPRPQLTWYGDMSPIVPPVGTPFFKGFLKFKTCSHRSASYVHVDLLTYGQILPTHWQVLLAYQQVSTSLVDMLLRLVDICLASVPFLANTHTHSFDIVVGTVPSA